MNFKSGFVSIIGKPNVGKSTLMNKLVGESISIVSPKVQTTRHRIKGILNSDDYQIIFSDTPGIMKPAYKLQEKMMGAVESSFEDADVMLWMVEAREHQPDAGAAERLEDDLKFIEKKIRAKKVPFIVVVNKIDLLNETQLETNIQYWQEKLKPDELIPLSATENFNTDILLKLILKYLPENEPYFPKDEYTDRNERFFAAEIIRERILYNYQREIPYSVEVKVDAFTEDEKLIRIHANIYVLRDSQKAIILGHKGAAIKQTASQARVNMEKFFNKKVFLFVYFY